MKDVLLKPLHSIGEIIGKSILGDDFSLPEFKQPAQISPLQIEDIEGLDAIPFFPLAIGWWIVIAILIAPFILYFLIKIKQLLYRKTWQYKTSVLLDDLLMRVGKDDAKYIISELSELLKKISIKRFGRKDCASLYGESFIAWLDEKDSGKFGWKNNGQILADYIYAPPGFVPDNDNLSLLIKTAARWVKNV